MSLIAQIADNQIRLLNVLKAHLEGRGRLNPKAYKEAKLLAEYFDHCLTFLQANPSGEYADHPTVGHCVRCGFPARMAGVRSSEDYTSHICLSNN
jgi:hypothetical protein